MQYNVIDVNSAQYKQDMQRLQSLRTQVVLWLIVLALGIVIIPLVLITGWVRNDVARLESELLSVQSALNDATTPNEEAIKLSADVAHINQLISTIQTVTISSGVNWPLVMDAATRYNPATIQITSLTQTNDKLQIAGRAMSNDAVVRYQQTLLESGVFRDVVVVSMSTVPPPPTPTVTDQDSATPSAPVDLPFGDVEFIMDIVVGSPLR